MKRQSGPLLVAIVGGSGSGKTWLADRLQAKLGKMATRLSLDDFYRDRSHLPALRRARINFDHPRAIDWNRLERVLRDCVAWRSTRMPQYDFKTHSRRAETKVLHPRPVIFMDGLWLLRRPRIRQLFDLRIFIECPAKLRLNRRMERDLLLRGRTRASIKRQFQEAVEPMHIQYVVPQKRWAHIRWPSPISDGDIFHLAGQLRALSKMIKTTDD